MSENERRMRQKIQRERNEENAKVLAAGTIGMPVVYRTDEGPAEITTMESMPWHLGGHTWVVKIAGHSGGVDCGRVIPSVKPKTKVTIV